MKITIFGTVRCSITNQSRVNFNEGKILKINKNESSLRKKIRFSKNKYSFYHQIEKIPAIKT